MKRFFVCFLSAVLAVGLAAPAHAGQEPDVSAASYILMEAESGRVLASRNEDEPRLIASTTKIMTALIALECCDPDAEVEIDPAWTGIEGSSMYLAPGQTLTVRELLYGLMLASGNDAAVALACIAAGSVESFAALMNEKAAELGCANTHFENPNGLDAQTHYSSARDLALITRCALQNDDFVRIVSTSSMEVDGVTLTNHNRLLRECEGVFGVKTGYTEAAGRTLVTCCERDGVTLICVTLSDPDDWRDHAALYDWGYAEFEKTELITPDDLWMIPVIGGTAESVSVSAEEPLSVFRRQGEEVTLRMCLPTFVYAAVNEGDTAGTASVRLDGEEVSSVSLVYADTVLREREPSPTLAEGLLSLFRLTERKIYLLT